MDNLAIIILNYNSSSKIITQVNKLKEEGINPSAFYIVDNDSAENDKKNYKIILHTSPSILHNPRKTEDMQKEIF